jgi:hypothetical protein
MEEEEVDYPVSVVLIASAHPAESILLVFVAWSWTTFTMTLNFAASILVFSRAKIFCTVQTRMITLYVSFLVIPRRLNYPEENIQHTEHGESLKSRMGWLRSPRVSAALVWLRRFNHVVRNFLRLAICGCCRPLST